VRVPTTPPRPKRLTVLARSFTTQAVAKWSSTGEMDGFVILTPFRQVTIRFLLETSTETSPWRVLELACGMPRHPARTFAS
jgi:hypothetical protein